MCRPPERVAEPAQQLSDRAVGGHRVAGRPDRPVVEPAIAAGGKTPRRLNSGCRSGCLVLVEPLRIGLPGLDHRPGDRPAVEIDHPAGDGERLADPVERDVGAERQARRIRPVERPAHRVGRCARRTAGVDLLDQRGDAEQVRKQGPFLALVVAGMADLRQELDRPAPFRRGRPGLADDAVQVRDRGHQKIRQRTAGPLGQPLRNQLGGIVLAERRCHLVLPPAMVTAHFVSVDDFFHQLV